MECISAKDVYFEVIRIGLKRDTFTSNFNILIKKRFLKQQLHSYLSCNIKAKAIICGNVAKSLIAIQDEVRLWMTDPSSIIHGTTALVIGSEDTVWKKLYTVQFTSSFSNEEIEDPTVFTPRILIGTSGCIGAGIDCDDISLVARLGMPTSLMHLIQEIGRCGRNMSGEYENILNCYH